MGRSLICTPPICCRLLLSWGYKAVHRTMSTLPWSRLCRHAGKMSCPQTSMDITLLLSFMLLRYLIARGWWSNRSKRNLILGIILSTSSRFLAEGTPFCILLIWESCHIIALAVCLPYLRGRQLHERTD